MTITTEHYGLADASFRVGDWLVEPRLNRLTRGDESIQIELKMMDVLVCLAERAGELVTRREITDTVWATEFITEKTLTRAVAELRRTLGDDAKDPRYIETIHRKGYRLIAPAEVVQQPTATVTAFPARSVQREDDRSPYPGLAAFTEADAEFFFGREAEVAQLWRKLTGRRLLAVIGPSGVGKSSFLRAGLVPAAPDGWGVVVCQPGDAPLSGLARALLPDFEGDREAVEGLVGVRDADTAATLVARWRQLHGRALLIVDQFEELFTLNPPEPQARFAELLGHLARKADVHVLLSMRDDFLYRCHDHEELEPIFDALTPVKVPAHGNLRRALEQPAARFAYAFEDEGLVDEMLEAVEGERGALPMLAFAVERLWEERDRERKLLTRQAYADIGGVGGALAHHAEATLERIGRDRLAVVRELFRNLITAEGTRAVREWGELLSVFAGDDAGRPTVGAGFIPARESAEDVLRELIDARLLTSYEICEDDEEPTRRVEIIHESLLTNWPRLVGWQTQDADSARMRDALRQAARTWDEHDRSADFLWTGKAFREYSVWRENYLGGVTELEDDFAGAMVAHVKRRKRRRRIAVAAAFLVLLAVLGVVGVSRQQAIAEANRAEASKLVALGQLELEHNPSSAVAFATASLELADTFSARMLALTALWRGPTALVVNRHPSVQPAFSPNGSWLLQTGLAPSQVTPLRAVLADGSSEILEETHETIIGRFYPSSSFFVSYNWAGYPSPRRVVLWSADDRRKLAEFTYEEPVRILRVGASRDRVVMLVVEDGVASLDALGVDGTHQRLGTPKFDPETWRYGRSAIARASGRWLGAVVGDEVMVIEIKEAGLSEPRRLGRLEDEFAWVGFDPMGRFVVTAEKNGSLKLWDVRGHAPPTLLRGPPGITGLRMEMDGSLLAANARTPARSHSAGGIGTALARFEPDADRGQSWIWALDGEEPRLLRRLNGLVSHLDAVGGHAAKDGRDSEVRLWSLAAPAAAEAIQLRRGAIGAVYNLCFHPSGRWLASADEAGLVLWPLARPYPAVIRAHDDAVNGLVFEPQGQWLASISKDGTLKLWPLGSGGEVRVFEVAGGAVGLDRGLAVSSDGTRLLEASERDGVQMLLLDSPDDGEWVDLPGFPGGAVAAAFNRDGRLAAGTAFGWTDPADSVVRIWSMESMQEVMVLGRGQVNIGESLAFTAAGRLLSSTESGLCRWELDTGSCEKLFSGKVFKFTTSADGGRVLLVDTPLLGSRPSGGSAVLMDLKTRATTRLESHVSSVCSVAMDAAGELVVTGSTDGTIRVGKANGGDPHLLLGHEGRVRNLAVDPKGRWIASGGKDGTVRLWPMPDLDAPPLHALPHDELIAKLHSLTNLRAVRDEESATGWKLEVGPFPGWETVPTW